MKNLRGLSFDELRPEDLHHARQHTGRDEGDMLALHSFPCRHDEIDAFVSHAWGDDFEQRYVALRGWAMQFEAEHGRWPVIWLDKACGDANAIVFLPPHGRDSVHLTDWSEIGPSKSVEQPKRIRR